MGARIPIIHKVYVKSRHLSRVFKKKIEPILYPSAVNFEFYSKKRKDIAVRKAAKASTKVFKGRLPTAFAVPQLTYATG
jgi:hypothetical protein